ncbi:uncharacterized protein LOC126844859 isoform X2 [Adelges cooleyi]|uniref:uncharacterized protein LOC126844859 isoform X1 n=1 Tax=Adelges cooleyi TaxID=133065 RepID=UPI0021800462|nr:uncharacterized protein LOC126844859 isoform X1 [Adelges cooleyi]XP_050439250.1 uncharacterized protein LOC126844859 isoform X2 [Adelges cooleyi]
MFFTSCLKSTWFSEASMRFDIISELPVEISMMIFRDYLIGEDINTACKVSRRWRRFCLNDKRLNCKLKSYRRNREIANRGSRFYKLFNDSGSLKKMKSILKKKKKRHYSTKETIILCLR